MRLKLSETDLTGGSRFKTQVEYGRCSDYRCLGRLKLLRATVADAFPGPDFAE